MIRPRSIAGLAGGCVLIAIANAVILGTAVSNRRGAPPVSITLTERELALPEFREDSDSGLFLEFRFAGQTPPVIARAMRRRGYSPPPLDTPWFDAAKLRELRFRIDPPSASAEEAHDHSGGAARSACVALEFDGDAWARLLAAREERVASIRKDVDAGTAEPQTLADAEAALGADRVMRSRLVPIDAARDCDTLRDRYAGRDRVVVLDAVVSAVHEGEGTDATAWRGRIDSLLVADVPVPAGLRFALEPLLAVETGTAAVQREQRARPAAWPVAVPPRYRATVAFGRRNEPWLVGVEPLR